MAHLGDYDASTVVYGHFTTYRPSTGAAYTLGGTPALSVYKDNSATQSTSGVSLTADFDSVTGLNYFAIDTSSDGTFYAAGSNFSVVITTGTVDSVSVVGAVVASFTIRKNSALKPATAGRTLEINTDGQAQANVMQFGSTNGTFASGRPEVNTTHWSGTQNSSTEVRANLINIAGSAVNTSSAQLGVNIVNAAGTAWNSAAITASTIGPGAIDADALAADAAAEIADAVWDEQRSGHVGGGSFGEGVASVQGNVTGNVGGNVTGSVGSLAAQAKADVNAEVLDVLNTDTFAEPAQGAPGATITLAQKIGFLYKAWRNRATQTSSQYSLYNDDAATVDHKATFSDNGTTADRGEIASGP